MTTTHRRAIGLLLGALLAALALSLSAFGASAPVADAANAAPCYGTGTPAVFGGTPPWGYRTGASLSPTASTGSFARAYGDIDLATGSISGQICQVNVQGGRQNQVLMAAMSPITFHTHVANMWGYPGNEIKAHVRITSSDDASCKVGTVGLMTMYASYNNVRSDSVQYRFPAACRSHDHLYHGSQVNAQVPPQ